MSQPARAQEPSMEEILASIRRIIADDDASKSPAQAESPMPPPPPRRAAPAPGPVTPLPPAPPPVEPVMQQGDFDSMLADVEKPAEAAGDVLDLTESMAAEPVSVPPVMFDSGPVKPEQP